MIPGQKYLKEFAWLAYPVAAVTFVVVSLAIVLGRGRAGVAQLFLKTAQVDDQAKRATLLRTKVALLRGVLEAALERDLLQLTGAVPATKQLFALLGEIDAAASVAGVRVDKYSAGVGELKEATDSAGLDSGLRMELFVSVYDFSYLTLFIKELERRLPIIKVGEVKYGGGGAQIAVEQKWYPVVASGVGGEERLPDYEMKVDKVKKLLEAYEPFPLEVEGGEEVIEEEFTNPNPI